MKHTAPPSDGIYPVLPATEKRLSPNPVTFAWVGDLHLTHAGQVNDLSARHIINEINEVVRPDVVQFAGDNAQNGTPEQFALFKALFDSVNAPLKRALVGDHDVETGDVDGVMHFDPAATNYVEHFLRPTGDASGLTWGVDTVGKFRFVRLNTMDLPGEVTAKHGMTDAQLDFFEEAAAAAERDGKRLVVCQHHYPFKVFEQFMLDGMDRWRRIVRTHKPLVVFCGHTHYGQFANDGQCAFVTTRSVGDPEGGPAAYTIAHLADGELAVRTRDVGQAGPILLIVSPRHRLLATGPDDIATDGLTVKVRCWSAGGLATPIEMRLNDQRWTDLRPQTDGTWALRIGDPDLVPPKGLNRLAVRATDRAGRGGTHEIRFVYDPNGRYTPVPGVEPVVDRTDFA